MSLVNFKVKESKAKRTEPTSSPGLFPQPIFWGKSPGDEVGNEADTLDTVPAVTQILQHKSAFWQDSLTIRPVLNRSHELNDGFYPFYRGGKIAIQTGPVLF